MDLTDAVVFFIIVLKIKTEEGRKKEGRFFLLENLRLQLTTENKINYILIDHKRPIKTNYYFLFEQYTQTNRNRMHVYNI